MPIRVLPSLNERPALTSIADVIAEIDQTPKPDIFPDKIIKLGPCGFGAPVIQSSQALGDMEPGEILQTESSHICSYPDIHSWISRRGDVELIGEDYRDDTLVYFMRRKP